ncbi:unnamed protein product [Rotaria magnacalcarata]|uniref:Uncharacterized protein n=1 Tax=Rotaria magnacalcarata TaxID=392030 RepID=A0A816RF14_9BILA|nr:unnamed protein product [Rotaria magnacalcarata]CAF4311357.1 unnamed protein product [Rotaria magnacalcarata]
MIWVYLVRAIRKPITASPNPLPSLAKLSVKDRLSHSTPNLSYQPRETTKWKGKGKGKGKRASPYPGSFKDVAAHGSQDNSSPPVGTPYPSAPPQQSGGYWVPPPYYSAVQSPTPSKPSYVPSTKVPCAPLSQDKLLEETSDTYGNLSWRPLPAEPISTIGTINYSSPHAWNWDFHVQEVDRIEGKSLINSLAHQNIFREQAALIVRQRALEEMRQGLNSSVNAAASTLAHRTMYNFSSPPEHFAQVHRDLQGLMPPPPAPPPIQ